MFRKSKSASCGSISAALIILLVPSLVHAADFPPIFDPGDAPKQPDPQRFSFPARQKLHDWEVIVGGGAMLQPKYEGSDEMEVSPLPFVSATFFDRLTIDPSGVELKVYELGPIKFDVKAGYEFGRKEKDANDLRGMGDIDGGVTVGGGTTLSYGPVEFFASFDKTIGGSEGLLGTLGAEFTQPVNEKLILGARASATFADENHMNSYFGATSAQAARSGYKRYKPDAGVKNIDLSVSATYMFKENWVVRAEQEVGFLVGDAANSPLVKREIQPKSMLFLGYRF